MSKTIAVLAVLTLAVAAPAWANMPLTWTETTFQSASAGGSAAWDPVEGAYHLVGQAAHAGWESVGVILEFDTAIPAWALGGLTFQTKIINDTGPGRSVITQYMFDTDLDNDRAEADFPAWQESDTDPNTPTHEPEHDPALLGVGPGSGGDDWWWQAMRNLPNGGAHPEVVYTTQNVYAPALDNGAWPVNVAQTGNGSPWVSPGNYPAILANLPVNGVTRTTPLYRVYLTLGLSYYFDSYDLYLKDVQISTLIPDGDANLDGKVDGSDLAIMATNWLGAGNWLLANFTADAVINGSDLAIMATNWNYGVSDGSPVPEPTTLILLGLGAVTLIRRRRAA